MYVKQYKEGETPILSRKHAASKKKWNVKLKSYFLSKIVTMRHWNWLGQCSRYIFIYVTQVSYTIWTWLWSVCEPRRSACNTLTMSYRPMWDKAFSSTPRDVFRLLLAQVCSIVWQQWTLSPYVSNCFIFSGVYPKIKDMSYLSCFDRER